VPTLNDIQLFIRIQDVLYPQMNSPEELVFGQSKYSRFFTLNAKGNKKVEKMGRNTWI